MRAFSTIARCSLLPTVAAVVIGCSQDPTTGYTTRSQYPRDVKSVAVPIWKVGPVVYRRNLEDRLTEALQKAIKTYAGYRITTRERADTELVGTIDAIEQSELSKNPNTGDPREMEITFVVSFTWKDLRTRKVRTEKTDFRVTDTYIPAEPIGEDFFQGSESLINRLARRIVEKMQESW